MAIRTGFDARTIQFLKEEGAYQAYIQITRSVNFAGASSMAKDMDATYIDKSYLNNLYPWSQAKKDIRHLFPAFKYYITIDVPPRQPGFVTSDRNHFRGGKFDRMRKTIISDIQTQVLPIFKAKVRELSGDTGPEPYVGAEDDFFSDNKPAVAKPASPDRGRPMAMTRKRSKSQRRSRSTSKGRKGKSRSLSKSKSLSKSRSLSKERARGEFKPELDHLIYEDGAAFWD